VFSQTYDVTEKAQRGLNRVRGKTLSEALFALAFVTSVPSLQELKAIVEIISKNSFAEEIASFSLVNLDGKLTGRRPSLLSGITFSIAVLISLG